MNWAGWMLSLVGSLLIASLPASTNYKLNSYGVGTGGTAGSSSTNYSVNGITGEQAGSGSSTNYSAGAGENFLKQANVPLVTLTNPTASYDKLYVVIDPQSNPSDSKFIIAISPDNFVTTTQYVQSDYTVSSSYSASDFMSYAAWGGATGITIRGLAPSTVYTAKAAAMHGNFTQSQYGPTSSVSTQTPGLTFGIGVDSVYNVTSPPYNLSFGNLLSGSVITASNDIWFTINSNAENGAAIYGEGQYGGLYSSNQGHLIPTVSTTADLASASEGFGEQDTSVSQSVGGPMYEVTPFNVTGTNVGQDYTSFDEWFGTDFPVTAGIGELSLLAKTNNLTPYAGDYTETLTAVVAQDF